MPEIKREVKAFEVNYCCDECSKKPNPGCILKATGEALMKFNPTYIYKCSNCNNLFELCKLYPKIEYEYVEDNWG